jgi:ubiquinone/menaquinone biosynthesis C-methylase UbiE
MTALGRLAMNSPGRAFGQRRCVVPALRRMGGTLDGCRVLEVGCGGGAGVELIVDVLGAASVDALDIDPRMVERARDRLRSRAAVTVAVGDVTALDARDATYDVVVDFGTTHLVPNWEVGVAEIARVLVPGGRYCFEQIVRRWHRLVVPLATGHRDRARFTETAFLRALAGHRLDVDGVARPRGWAATFMVGDLVGVATKRD